MTNMLNEALGYAKRGWYVFPCREKPGSSFQRNGETVIPTEKQPYVSKGLNDATLDEEQITAWWKMWPNAMIGINAGKSGLFVVDIDKKKVNGFDTYSKWAINDSAGLMSVTPSGGTHIIFSGKGKSSTNAETGIDTRGEGGYFIAPPSKIIEGSITGEYKVFNDWSKAPGVIPDGLMGRLFPDKTVEYVRGEIKAYSNGEKKQLSRATLNFFANGAKSGERNSTLFKVLADFAGCGYTQEEAREAVQPIALRIGLSGGEFEQVLTHAYSKPRSPSIPDSIQEKILSGDKSVASKITPEEQGIIEKALLACMMTDNSVIPIIQDILVYQDFQILSNKYIYKIILKIYNTGQKVDFVTVSSELQKETDKISLNDITTIVNNYFIDPEAAGSYANIVREKSSMRKIESLMDNKEYYMKKGGLIEIISTIEKDISDIALYGGAKSTNILTGEQAALSVIEQTKLLASGQIQQLKTGFTIFDNEVGGFYSNELIIGAGRAGDGKSALGLTLLNNMAINDNKSVLMFSLEMSTHETLCRLICQMTGIPYKRVYQGKMSEKEWKEYREAFDRISSSKLYFDDTYGITVPEMRSKIRKMVNSKKIDFIIIDQLEQIKGYEGMAQHIRLDSIGYDIKNFTKEFDIPILLNHQLNRASTDRKLKNVELQLSDLNQAGEKPANQVWAITHKKDEHDTIIQSKIKMLKNRNGPKIEFALNYIGERFLFANPAKEEAPFVNSNQGQDDDYEVSSRPPWEN